MKIDIDELRNDLKEESYGAFFAGGYGGALMESLEVEKAAPDELIGIAKSKGINLDDYIERSTK